MAQKKNAPKPAPAPAAATGSRAKWVIVAMIVVAVAGVFLAVSRPGGELPASGNVGNSDVQTLVDQGARLIDVRTAAEFDGGHIPGAENVPVDQISAVAASWDRTKPVVLYCATGSRSVAAMQALVGAGFTSVYNLTAGIAAWDGEVTTDGPATATAAASAPSASGLPVMYEFYTDW
ncbi:MAG: rhodanese-like domain-containing protein [Coriobacteriia bacterium]